MGVWVVWHFAVQRRVYSGSNLLSSPTPSVAVWWGWSYPPPAASYPLRLCFVSPGQSHRIPPVASCIPCQLRCIPRLSRRISRQARRIPDEAVRPIPHRPCRVPDEAVRHISRASRVVSPANSPAIRVVSPHQSQYIPRQPLRLRRISRQPHRQEAREEVVIRHFSSFLCSLPPSPRLLLLYYYY